MCLLPASFVRNMTENGLENTSKTFLKPQPKSQKFEINCAFYSLVCLWDDCGMIVG